MIRQLWTLGEPVLKQGWLGFSWWKQGSKREQLINPWCLESQDCRYHLLQKVACQHWASKCLCKLPFLLSIITLIKTPPQSLGCKGSYNCHVCFNDLVSSRIWESFGPSSYADSPRVNQNGARAPSLRTGTGVSCRVEAVLAFGRKRQWDQSYDWKNTMQE